jgi:hypothetical protein
MAASFVASRTALAYLSCFEGALCPQTLQRIERGLDWRAGRPLLDVRARHFVTLAELVDQPGRVGARVISGKKIVLSGKNVIDAGPSGLREQRGGNTTARRHAAEVEGFLNVFDVAIPGSQPG